MLRKLLGEDYATSLAGLVSVVFVSLYLMRGGCSLQDYLLALATIATAFGLFKAKDSRPAETSVQSQTEKE